MPDVTPIVLQQIDLDIVPGKIPPIVHVSEYDTGRQILVNLFRDGYPFGSNSIESYTVKVEGTIGKYGFSEDATWADDAEGVVVIHLTEAMTAIHGRVWTKIKLIKSESMQISTCGFWLDVDRAGVEAATVIGAPGFQEQINQGVIDYLDDHQPFFELPSGGQSGQALVSDGEGGAEWGRAGVEVDSTLTQTGKAADAKVVGDALKFGSDSDSVPISSAGNITGYITENRPTIQSVISDDCRIAYYSIEAGRIYKVRKTVSSNTYKIGFCENVPATGVSVFGVETINGIEYQFTNVSNYHYLAVYYAYNDQNPEAILASLSVTRSGIVDLHTKIEQIEDEIAGISVEVETDETLSTPGVPADAAAVGEAIAAIDTGGSGFTAQFVTAFSNFLDHLSGVFDDPNGQTYIDALKNALQGGESSDGITFLNGVLRISETASVTATQSGSTLALT